jgi:hypothetical protein
MPNSEEAPACGSIEEGASVSPYTSLPVPEEGRQAASNRTAVNKMTAETRNHFIVFLTAI